MIFLHVLNENAAMPQINAFNKSSAGGEGEGLYTNIATFHKREYSLLM